MRFFLYYGDPCLIARRIDSCHQPPAESAYKPLFEGWNLAWRAIGAEDNLFSIIVKRVESMEEFFLALFAFA